MRIVSNGELPEGKSPERASGQNAAAGGVAANVAVNEAAPAAAGAGSQQRIASDTTQISKLGSKISSVPEIRQDRVAALSAQVQSGKYQVSDQQIADSMLRDFRMTGGSAQ